MSGHIEAAGIHLTGLEKEHSLVVLDHLSVALDGSWGAGRMNAYLNKLS